MATTTINTTQYQKIVDCQAGTHTPNAPMDAAGKLRAVWFTGTSAVGDAGSTIKFAVLPAGARVLGIKWASQDMSAGAATIIFGDAGDTDRLVSALDVGTAAVGYAALTLRSPTTLEPDIGFGYKYTAETVITGTTGAAAMTAGGLFWGCIEYVVE